MLWMDEGPSQGAIGICTALHRSLGPSSPSQGCCPRSKTFRLLSHLLHFCLGTPFTMHVSGDKVAACFSISDFGQTQIFSLFHHHLGVEFGRPNEQAFLLSRTKRPFTPSQWMELEHQALIYKYLHAKAPIPSSLLISISKSFRTSNRGVHIQTFKFSLLSILRNSKLFQ